MTTPPFTTAPPASSPPPAIDPPASSPPPSSPAPTKTPGETDPDSLQSFRQKCEDGVASWRSGQVVRPEKLRLPLARGTTYNAAVDIRDELLPPADLVENNGTLKSELIEVKCILAARLVAVDDGITVTPPGDDDWVYREFPPSGAVEWAWSVTATTPDEHQLRLDLRPAVRLGGLPSAASETLVSSFTTDVTVDATAIEETSHWFSTEWTNLAKIAGALAAAVTAVVATGRKLMGEDRFNATFGRWFSGLFSRLGAHLKPGAHKGDAS